MRRLIGVCLLAVLAACGGGDGNPAAPSPSAPLTVTDVRVGTGAQVGNGAILSVTYTGWLHDASRPDGKGTQFDSNAGGSPFLFVLGARQVITGWDQGLVGMRVGGLRRLVIPPELAYGSAGAGNGVIPPNATLVFDVELLAAQ